ncbi:MAG: hypothetical protein Q8P50_00785 [Bacillota bacterium]|nr:hypothetical protein [Bacillota bacterium]
MRVYIVSSWRNAETIRKMADYLRLRGMEVDDFTDSRGGERYVFDRYVFDARGCGLENADAMEFLRDERVQRAFAEDKRGLDWAEGVLLILPAGRSAHLEAGYAVGKGKKLVILGEFPPGEYDTMYGFADLLTRDPVEAADCLLAVHNERQA